jgi:hypothetical protein
MHCSVFEGISFGEAEFFIFKPKRKTTLKSSDIYFLDKMFWPTTCGWNGVQGDQIREWKQRRLKSTVS